MKTTKKFLFVSLLIGAMVSSTLFVLGQNANIIPQPIVYAGEDVTICDEDNFQIGGISTFTGVTLWITSGDGLFKTPHKLKTVYLPGKMDLAIGRVSLTLISMQPGDFGNYPKNSDSMTLYFEKCTPGIGIWE